MKQLGIKTENFDAVRVVVEMADGSKLVFDKPQVMAMVMQGQKTFTVMGNPREEKNAGAIAGFTDDDIQTVIEQTGASREDAANALIETDGDMAEAIIKLKKD